MTNLREEIAEISIWAYEYFIGEDYDETHNLSKQSVGTFSDRLYNKIMNKKMKLRCPLCDKDGNWNRLLDTVKVAKEICPNCKGTRYIEKPLKKIIKELKI